MLREGDLNDLNHDETINLSLVSQYFFTPASYIYTSKTF